MLIDARSVPQNTVVKAEVCIIGAGAAGITLAREFAGQDFRVCLLESGRLDFDEDTQSLYKGENIGIPRYALDIVRARYFGGTTNYWAGYCRPLDKIDFEARDWIPYSGWPFGRDHLDPYYERAQPICQLGRYAYGVGDWEEPKTDPRLPFIGDRVITTVFQMSPPTRFGKVYRDKIENANNIEIYLNANAVDIETTRTSGSATRLWVACLNGNRFWVSARLFILAMGGIENARLLLLSNRVQHAGLGNHHDLVGRFFMEHLEMVAGPIALSDPFTPTGLYLKGYQPQTTEAPMSGIQGVIALSERTLRQEKLANLCILLFPLDEPRGIVSLQHLLWSLRQGKIPDNFWKHVGNVIADIDDVAVSSYGKLIKGRVPVRMYKVYTRSEQVPNPESRVTLFDERDSLGKHRVRLEGRPSAIDIATVKRGLEIIGEELGRARLGRLRSLPDEASNTWLQSLGGQHHHMGTTRMHVDPRQGVVNENCQVHGVSNLYIAGSSVFPTAGYSNPTLTIVALGLRLADHVKKVIRV